MARTPDQVMSNIVGEYISQIAVLVAQNEQLREKIVELEKAQPPKEDPIN